MLVAGCTVKSRQPAGSHAKAAVGDKWRFHTSSCGSAGTTAGRIIIVGLAVVS